MVSKVVWGELREPPVHDHDGHHVKLPADLNVREILTLAPIAVLCIAFGLFPKQTLIDAVEEPINNKVAFIEKLIQDGPAPPNLAEDHTPAVPDRVGPAIGSGDDPGSGEAANSIAGVTP